MALNFPQTPDIGDTYVQGGVTWIWDGVAWNVQGAEIGAGDVWYRINGNTGTTVPNQSNDTFNIVGGENIATAIVGDVLTINFTGEAGGIANAFSRVETDDGFADVASDQTININGGTNISTEIVTDTDNVLINLQPFSINFLSDVDTAGSPPSPGAVLKWDGTKWAPGADISAGGGGTDADTLDGFDSTYYLDYNNFTNTPAVATLTDFSVGNELTPTGNGAISYDNTTGVFRYTPPTAAGIGALTSVAFADLTSKPTTLAGYGITDAFDGDFASLTGTPTTLAGYGITDAPADLTDLGIADGSAGQVLTTDGAGNFTFTTVEGGGGGGPDQNLWATINGDLGSTTANSTTDTLTIAGGTNIDTSVTGDTVTISYTGTVGASTLTQLTDVPSELTVDKIYMPAIALLEITNFGTQAYLCNSHYAGSNNPTLYGISGTTLAFNLNVAGHPFEIQNPSGDPYNTGLVHVSTTGTVSTGADAQGKTSGTLYWKIPFGISGNYRYQCSVHAIMVGSITVKAFNAI